jgi:hypothetical protein
MLALSFRAWDPDETYGEGYWNQMTSCHEKIFAIEVCEKTIFFLAPPKNMHPFRSYNVGFFEKCRKNFWQYLKRYNF